MVSKQGVFEWITSAWFNKLQPCKCSCWNTALVRALLKSWILYCSWSRSADVSISSVACMPFHTNTIIACSCLLMRCTTLRRYVIFVRDQQQAARLQRQTGSNVESALDLVGYVEFQHSYR